MLRYIFPILLVIGSVLSFMYVTNPMYAKVKELQADKLIYQDAVEKSNTLVAEYDALVAKYNAVSPDDMDRLNKLLPDNADNIRLVLEMERLGAKYDMALTNVKFDTDPNAQTSSKSSRTGKDVKPYTEFKVMFTTQSSYESFIQFMSEMEKTLRLVDFKSIDFSSTDTNTKGIMKYNVTITTYYLKS